MGLGGSVLEGVWADQLPPQQHQQSSERMSISYGELDAPGPGSSMSFDYRRAPRPWSPIAEAEDASQKSVRRRRAAMLQSTAMMQGGASSLQDTSTDSSFKVNPFAV